MVSSPRQMINGGIKLENDKSPNKEFGGRNQNVGCDLSDVEEHVLVGRLFDYSVLLFCFICFFVLFGGGSHFS